MSTWRIGIGVVGIIVVSQDMTNNGIIGNKIIIGSQGILQRMGGKGRNPRIELGIIERSHQGVRVERAIGSPLCYQASYS